MWIVVVVLILIVLFIAGCRITNNVEIEGVRKCNEIVGKISIGDMVCKEEHYNPEGSSWEIEREFFYVRNIVMGHVGLLGAPAVYPRLDVEHVRNRECGSVELGILYTSGYYSGYFCSLKVIRDSSEKKEIESRCSQYKKM